MNDHPDPMEGFAKAEMQFIISQLFGWRRKDDGTRRFKRAFLDRKYVSDMRLLTILFAGMELDSELAGKWNFLFLPNERTVKRLWKQFGKYDLQSLRVRQVRPREMHGGLMRVGRPYFENQRTGSSLGIVFERDLKQLAQRHLTENSGCVAFSQIQSFKNPEKIYESFENPSLLIMTMTHDSKRHTARSRKFLKEPTEDLMNDLIDDESFVFIGGHGY